MGKVGKERRFHRKVDLLPKISICKIKVPCESFDGFYTS